MANAEQLSILKQGVNVWNKWHINNRNISGGNVYPDLSYANLQNADLRRADLRGADLRGADLRGAQLPQATLNGAYLSTAKLDGADLNKADITGAELFVGSLQGTNLSNSNLHLADLSQCNLRKSNLKGAILMEASLKGAKLSEANLASADLSGADFSGADLEGANLTGANLSSADLSEADLKGSNFGQVTIANTKFGDLNLSHVEGLEKVVHSAPSTIGTNTIAKSIGKIPEVFLRGCGLRDWEIEMAKLYAPDLANEERSKILYKIYDLQATQAIQISPLFISYSHIDALFVEKVGNYLNGMGVRFWRDVHHAPAGRLEKVIDRAMRLNPTVLLVLSSNSLQSDWVEHEVRTARGLEKEMGRDVLCPVALDDSWKSSRWPERIMEQITEYNILDFSAWQDDVKFDGMFRRLVNGLELFYKG